MRIPVETRKKMVAAVERGESVASVARRFEVSERGLRNILRRYREQGTLAPGKTGPKKPIKLTPADDARMLQLVRADPGVTLQQICDQLSVTVVESTVSRRLRKLGLSLKKSP